MGSRLFFYYRGSISGVSDFQPTKGLQSSEPNLKKSSQKAVWSQTIPLFVILWLALHRCRCLWRRRQRRRRCRGLHRPHRGLRPWRHPRHPGPHHGRPSRRPSGVRYPPGRAWWYWGVLRHGAGLGGDNRRGSRSHIRGFIAGTSGQRQSQSEPDAEQSPCAFHVCSSCSFQWISFRWIHPAPSIRYSTLITRGKKCQRKKGCNFQKDLLI